MKDDLYLAYQFLVRQIVASYLLKQYLKTECPSMWTESVLPSFVCIINLFSTLFLPSNHLHPQALSF